MILALCVLVQLNLTSKVDITGVAVEGGVGAMGGPGLLLPGKQFLGHRVIGVTVPALEEESDILIVSLPFIMHFGLNWRRCIAAAEVTM